ncbi:hypothetical protein TWF281_007860 [Arthrobotrys megalospora]
MVTDVELLPMNTVPDVGEVTKPPAEYVSLDLRRNPNEDEDDAPPGPLKASGDVKPLATARGAPTIATKNPRRLHCEQAESKIQTLRAQVRELERGKEGQNKRIRELERENSTLKALISTIDTKARTVLENYEILALEFADKSVRLIKLERDHYDRQGTVLLRSRSRDAGASEDSSLSPTSSLRL